ncbi:hypothetical protein Scep_003916 [Stephania cephalantha]|uniref:Nudix hydrolase 16, mitochondrial n=1 Tax=Stephania cephalantha TaxID=152367 RepID=A0AAP0PUV4_9MAGN
MATLPKSVQTFDILALGHRHTPPRAYIFLPVFNWFFIVGEGSPPANTLVATPFMHFTYLQSHYQEFLGYYHFKSKTHQDEFCPEGRCKAAMFALHVKEELNSWPEQSTRQRRWLTITEAAEQCRHPWMRAALMDGFSKWLESIKSGEGHPGSGSSSS